MLILMIIIALFLTAIISYLLGSLNSSIIVCKIWKKIDIRDFGSKNAGLTNTLRVFGKGPAIATLCGDLAKGVLSVIISRGIVDTIGVFDDTMFIGYIAGIFCMVGHVFPLYYGFHGGKGVLVASSILLAIDPLTFCIVIPFFLIMVFITKYVSVSSISAALAYPLITLFTQLIRGVDTAILNTCLAYFTGLFIIYMHRANIERLKNGTENKFKKK